MFFSYCHLPVWVSYPNSHPFLKFFVFPTLFDQIGWGQKCENPYNHICMYTEGDIGLAAVDSIAKGVSLYVCKNFAYA